MTSPPTWGEGRRTIVVEGCLPLKDKCAKHRDTTTDLENKIAYDSHSP